MQITQKKLMFQIMYITRADFEHSSFDTKNKSGEKIRYSFFFWSHGKCFIPSNTTVTLALHVD